MLLNSGLYLRVDQISMYDLADIFLGMASIDRITLPQSFHDVMIALEGCIATGDSVKFPALEKDGVIPGCNRVRLPTPRNSRAAQERTQRTRTRHTSLSPHAPTPLLLLLRVWPSLPLHWDRSGFLRGRLH